MAGMNIRIAANLSELKKNLAEGRMQIETTTAAMKKMAAGLQGDKLIQQAHNITAAVHSLGGAAKLTEAEKKKLNSTLEKALEKYKALGREAPPAMVALYEATKKTEAASSSWFSKFSAGAVAIGTAVGTFIGNMAVKGVTALAEGVVSLAKRGAEIGPIVNSFNSLTASIDESADVMLGKARTATRGLVTDIDLMAAANKAINLGLPVTSDSFAKLTQQAVVLGRAMKMDATKSVNDLIEGLGKGSPAVLNNVGIIVKAESAYEAYANKIGKSTQALTDAEKTNAVYEAALVSAAEKVEKIGGLHLTVADHVDRMRNRFTNMMDSLSVAIETSPALNAVFETLADAIDGAVGDNQVDTVKRLTLFINEMALSVVTFVGHMITAAATAERVGAAVRLGTGQWSTFAEDQRIVRGDSDLQRNAAAATQRVDELKRKLEELKNQTGDTKTIVDQLSGRSGNGGLPPVTDEAKKAADAFQKWADQVTGRKLAEEVTLLASRVSALGEAAFTPHEWNNLGKQLQAFHEQGAQLPPMLDEIRRAYLQLAFDAKFGGQQLVESIQRPVQLTRAQINQMGMGGLVKGMDFFKLPGPMLNFPKPEKSTAPYVNTGQLGATVVQSIAGGGNVGAALGAQIGNDLGTKFADIASKKVAGFFTTGLGKIVAGALPGVGALMGPLVGKAFSALGNALGFGTAGRDLVTGYAEKMGGFDALREKLALLGDEGERLWVTLTQGVGRNNAKQAEQAIKDVERALKDYEEQQRKVADLQAQLQDQVGSLTGLLDRFGGRAPAAVRPLIQELLTMQGLTAEQHRLLSGMLEGPHWQAAEDAAGRLGVKLSSLGPAFQQAKLSDQALQTVRDLEIVIDTGADLDTVLRDAADHIQGLVTTAMTTGSVLPETLRPYIQRLIDLGKLVDPNGDLVTNIDQLKFADIEDDALKAIRDVLEEIRDLLANKIPAAAAAANSAIDGVDAPSGSYDRPSAPDPKYDADGTARAHSGAMVMRGKILKFHRGGMIPRLSADEVPAILQEGEGVLSRSAVSAIGGPAAVRALNVGGGGHSSQVVNVVVNGAPGQSEARLVDELVRRLPAELRRRGV